MPSVTSLTPSFFQKSLEKFSSLPPPSFPRFHPCRWVQEALRAAGISSTKVMAGHGSPFSWQRKPRPELVRLTGADQWPTLKLPDSTVLAQPRAILAWIKQAADSR